MIDSTDELPLTTDFIAIFHDGELVRNRDRHATKIGHRTQAGDHGSEIFRTRMDRHHHGVDTVFLEQRIEYRWRTNMFDRMGDAPENPGVPGNIKIGSHHHFRNSRVRRAITTQSITRAQSAAAGASLRA